MKNEYMLLYKHDHTEDWSVIQGKAVAQHKFLRNEVNDNILRECQWSIYEVAVAAHKDEFISSGAIDEILEEE